MNFARINVWVGGVAVALIALVAIWFFIFRSPSPTSPPSTGSFGAANSNSTSVTSNTSSAGANGTQPVNVAQQTSQQKIFEIAQGPVVGATFIQTLHPTTTLARYIMQENGHVYDLPLDVAGAIPRVVSNVTIPGGMRALWAEQGNAAIMQYLDGSTVKTVYMGFPAATTTGGATLPTKIQFLPNNIEDIAVSPDGKSVAYLLTTASGADGYVAKTNGTAATKLFSLPLAQLLLSWPAQGTLLAQTKSAAGAPGIVFSIDAKTGAATPLIYAQGITAVADKAFSEIVYQTIQEGAALRATYLHNVKTGVNVALSFDPFPEKCTWSVLNPSELYCAMPLSYVAQNYLDLWHQGASSVADSLVSFDTTTGKTTIIATPGGRDGGSQSDMYQLSLAPDEHYVSFTTKGDRALWGVRLSQ